VHNVLHCRPFVRTGKPPASHPLICRHSLWIGPLTFFHSCCIGLGASLSFGATSLTKKVTPSPSLSSGVVDRASEFHPSVVRLPHYELGLSTMSGDFTVGWGSLQCTPCQGLAAGEPPPAMPWNAH
jgi:hypothetical protein